MEIGANCPRLCTASERSSPSRPPGRAELAGRYAFDLFEGACEEIGVVRAARGGDVRDGIVREAQKLLGSRDTQAEQIFGNVDAKLGLESARQI